MIGESFTNGQTVRLKSGGPAMTITSLFRDGNGVSHANTAWFTDDKQDTGTFPVAALVPDDGEEPDILSG